MYSRVTLLEFDALRFDVGEALERFQELVLPELRAQPGYEGVLVLTNAEAKGLVVTLWASEEDADAGLASGFWAAQIERFVTVFAAPPGREGYEVVFTELPVFAPN
jgi:heme-degrading monooxygenase HmoA